MTKSISETFLEGYRNLVSSSDSRNSIKLFNKRLQDYKYILVYPYNANEDESNINMHLLVGFSNTAGVFKYGVDTMHEAYQLVANTNVTLKVSSTTEEIKETLVFETANCLPIPLETISWDNLLKAPQLHKGSFFLLKEFFIEFFAIQDESFEFNSFFAKEENKPEELELKVVWNDVDSYEKFGDIITLVCWKNETIGWVSSSGRWLDTHVAHTINPDTWTSMMQFIYDKTGFIPDNKLRGVYVHDITKDMVDDVCIVPGFDKPNYSE